MVLAVGWVRWPVSIWRSVELEMPAWVASCSWVWWSWPRRCRMVVPRVVWLVMGVPVVGGVVWCVDVGEGV